MKTGFLFFITFILLISQSLRAVEVLPASYSGDCSEENIDFSKIHAEKSLTLNFSFKHLTVQVTDGYGAKTCNAVIPIKSNVKKRFWISKVRYLAESELKDEKDVMAVLSQIFFQLEKKLFFENQVFAPLIGDHSTSNEFEPKSSFICATEGNLNLESLFFVEGLDTKTKIKELIVEVSFDENCVE